jgi:DNA-binding beta-propeller fold protein YncE
VCLDFPAISRDVGLMAHFTLSAAPDGHALYAVNAALGVAVEVRNLPIGTMRLVHLGMRAGAPMRMQDAAAISADGRRVFVATGSGVWVVDTGSLTVRETFVPDQEIGSVAISHDGRRLFALSQTSNQIDVLDSRGGSLVDGLQPSPNAWAIEAVR